MKSAVYFYFSPLLLALTLASCGPQPKVATEPHDLAGEKTANSHLKELDKKALLYPKYPAFITESLRDVQLVHHSWTSQFLYCKEGEKAVFVKAVAPNRYIALCKNSEGGFTFYDRQCDGTVNSQSHLERIPGWKINEGHNFLLEGTVIRYYLSREDGIEWEYDLSSHEHQVASQKRLDWAIIGSGDWGFYYNIPSPTKKKIAHISDVGISISHTATGRVDTFIQQEYTGNWSIGTGAWNAAESKFYFDNSGAVACIWELDLENRTLDKIVPKHEARLPSVMPATEQETLLYIENGCIKQVVRTEKLPGIL